MLKIKGGIDPILIPYIGINIGSMPPFIFNIFIGV